jgi:hypothetical protein
MKITKAILPAAAIVLAAGLAACGTTAAAAAPRAAVTVIATPTPTVTVTPTPTPTETKTVVVVSAQTVYAPAATTAVTNCGGVYAGPNTSCAFALNVAQAWRDSGGPAVASIVVNAYSPVTGLDYSMSCGVVGAGTVICTGGNNAYVQF